MLGGLEAHPANAAPRLARDAKLRVGEDPECVERIHGFGGCPPSRWAPTIARPVPSPECGVGVYFLLRTKRAWALVRRGLGVDRLLA